MDLQQLRQLDETPNPLAKEELNLLARLMGSMKAEDVPRTETGFRITLFPTDQEEEASVSFSLSSFLPYFHSLFPFCKSCCLSGSTGELQVELRTPRLK